MKFCNKCKLSLDESKFYVRKSNNKLLPRCKDCSKKDRKIYTSLNKDKIKIYKTNYNKINKDKNNKRSIRYTSLNKDKKSTSNRKYRLKNKDKINKKIKNWISNSENYKIHRRQRVRYRCKTEPDYRIKRLLRLRLYHTIQDGYKSAHTLELLGCSIDHLKQHLQQTAIKNGYLNFDINNYSGHQYHIDHIIPCSRFNLKCSFHQKLCFNWSNMQILNAKDNIKKHISIPAELVI
jgi:hypothetical protein